MDRVVAQMLQMPSDADASKAPATPMPRSSEPMATTPQTCAIQSASVTTITNASKDPAPHPTALVAALPPILDPNTGTFNTARFVQGAPAAISLTVDNSSSPAIDGSPFNTAQPHTPLPPMTALQVPPLCSGFNLGALHGRAPWPLGTNMAVTMPPMANGSAGGTAAPARGASGSAARKGRFSPYPSGAADPLYVSEQAKVRAEHGDEAADNLCYRCKLFDCKGTRTNSCVFQSNTFISTKERTCNSCAQPVISGKSIVTCMKRGQHAGVYLHRHCAAKWYENNPLEPDAPELPSLTFFPPTADMLVLIDTFVHGRARVCIAHQVAGGGKTNVMVACIEGLRKTVVAQMRAGQRAPTYKLLSFARAAREVLIERGLTPQECSSLNSDGNGQYCTALREHLKEYKLMEGALRPDELQLLEPKLVKNKLRLLTSCYLTSFEIEHAAALVKLCRPFVAALGDKARARAFGTPRHPSYHDAAAMRTVVDFFKLQKHLEDCWAVRLNVTERRSLEATHSLGTEEARLTFGVQLTGHVLDLDILSATSYSMQIHDKLITKLHNEVTNVDFALPLIDFSDQLFIPTVMQWVQPLDRVGIEEFHDSEELEIEYILLRCPKGSIMCNLDTCQQVHVWKGASPTAQEMLMSGEDAASHHEQKRLVVCGEENYRSSLAVNRAAQLSRARVPARDGLPELTIRTMRNVEGLYVESGGTFAAFPITTKGVVTCPILIVARKLHHVLLLCQVLTSRGVPVGMLGRPNVGVELAQLVQDLEGSLQQRYTLLCAFKATRAPSDASDDRYDMVCALVELIPAWAAERPHLDISDAAASPSRRIVEAFCSYVEDLFTKSASNPNVVQVGTVHASKGTQAFRTYIFQDKLVPLEERVEAGGWERDEELCLAYVADSRAEDELICLQNLEMVTRESIHFLFEPTGRVEAEAGGSSQETEAAADEGNGGAEDGGDGRDGGGSGGDDAAPSDGARPKMLVYGAITQALGVLELSTLPSTLVELNTVMRTRSMAVHPDKMRSHNLSFADANARTALLLEARNTIKLALEAGVTSHMMEQGGPGSCVPIKDPVSPGGRFSYMDPANTRGR